MQELQTQSRQLPDTLTDLSKFVLVGREKLNAVRAEIRAIEKVGLAKEVHEQKLAEAQDIADAVLDAEAKIGELTSRMKKASNQFACDSGVTGTKGKQLEAIGLNRKQASRYEAIAAHPVLVEQAKAEARENGDIVTRQDVLHKIAVEKDKYSQKRQELRGAKKRIEEFEAKKADGVISIEDVRQNKEDQELVSENFIDEFDKFLQQARHFRNMADDGRFEKGLSGLDRFEQRAIYTHLSEIMRAVIKLQRVTEESMHEK